ncbi:MAG TPA: efflux RND transporter periplasmic adaptor subunit, partial [Longimicrobiales bacterium]|nr:efflux RND transporter periplasmic adaptor subunit [Longimicrobiales bacterium]
LLILGAAGLLEAGCGGDAEAGGAPGTQAQAEQSYSRVINVEVRPVEATSFTERIRLTGTVHANRDVEVAAEESGRIEEILVEKGNPVRAGQPIMRIDGALLRAEVEQARARARMAEDTWNRRKALWENEGVGTEQAYVEARYAAQEAAANVERLEERLARTTIRAPFEGILDERRVELGSMVSPGVAVARIVDLDPVKIVGGVPERYAPDVETGTAARVSFDVFSGEVFEGKLTYVGATVNPDNRTFGVEFTLPNPDGLVKPQMVANIALVRRMLSDVVVVPQESLVRTEDGFRAFVVEEAGDGMVARARNVRTGPSQANQVVIHEGVEAGERIVVVGQQMVADGDRVRVVGSGAPETSGAGDGDAEVEAETEGGR